MGGTCFIAAVLLVTSSVITVVHCAPLVFHVSEELPSGTLVGNVKTSSNISQEVDEEDRDRLQFHILSSDGLRITSIFSINSKTGAIYTNAMIDREQLCDLDPVCQLEFDVTVKLDTNFLKLLTVRVIVDDVNDNAPAFPKGEITLTVPESAPVNSEIPISGALDRDAGINSSISYSLQVSSVFGLREVRQLEGSALRLVVQLSLDREAVPSYSFLILAADGEGPEALTGTLTVSVLVSDVNDNVPQFSKDTFDLTVLETAPVGTVFGHLTASDGDVGLNGQLTYRFSLLTTSEVTDLFSLNSTSGELSVAGGLQYESLRTFQCVVEVLDLGVPPQVSQAVLRIHVADAGNTPPKLDLILAEPVYGDQSAMLSEDVQVGTFVGTLKAEDLDEGAEGQVTCSSQDPHFSLQDLDTNRYGIVVSQALDREEQQEIRIVLLCSDGGDPQLTSSTEFKVIVRDVNDNAPEFSQRLYQASLTENGSGDQYVTRVTATDRDDSSNNVVTYYLDPQSSLLFSVNAVTGKVTTLSSFDREVTPFVTLTVYARDSGSPALTGTASVSVRIADVNDNVPYVNRTDYYVSENLPVGGIFNVSLADQDQGENGTVVAFLADEVDQELLPFTILPNGSFRILSALDRERQATYVIPLILRDRGSPPLSSTATLTLQLVDSNDHTPFFFFPTPSNDSVTIMTDVPVGSHVCQIKAEDGDLGMNGVVTYSIIDQDPGHWLAINNLTGDIFTVQALTPVAQSTLHLQVAASDQGTPPLVATAFLDVLVRANHSALPGPSGSDDEDRYVIIAGVIAGITFVIAIVVIAVIVHVRNSDLRRQAEMRNQGRKEVEEEGAAWKMAQMSVLYQNGVVLTDPSKPGSEVPAVGDSRGPQGLTVDRVGFKSLSLSIPGGTKQGCDGGVGATEDVPDLQYHPSYGGFSETEGRRSRNSDARIGPIQEMAPSSDDDSPHLSPWSSGAQGRNRTVSEDHNSDTSGETTTCDSGRGASDEEIVYPVCGKASCSADPPPRIPPRQPLSHTSQWSHDNPAVSASWALADPAHYITEENATRHTAEEEEEIDESSYLADDFRNRSRKGPMRVRFSFHEGDPRFSASNSVDMENRAYASSDQPDLTAAHVSAERGRQPHEAHHADGAQALANSMGTPGRLSVRDLHNQHGNRTFSSPTRHSERSGDSYYKDFRLNPESMYPRVDRFPRKQGGGQSCPSAWDRRPGRGRNLESLSSLVQSVDDDVSTTTSGSYSIESEDAMNVSLEC